VKQLSTYGDAPNFQEQIKPAKAGQKLGTKSKTFKAESVRMLAVEGEGKGKLVKP
jgi:hypothetical protein